MGDMRWLRSLLRRKPQADLRGEIIDDLLREGMDLLEVLDGRRDEERYPAVTTADEFEAKLHARLPGLSRIPVFKEEAAALGHDRYEPGEQSKVAGILDGLAAVWHVTRDPRWEPSERVPGPCRAWLHDSPSTWA